MECLSIAASTIVEIEVASLLCGKLQHIEDLPEAFIPVEGTLPLAEKTLHKIQQVLQSNSAGRDEDERAGAIRNGLHECLQLVRSTNDIFREIRIADILSPDTGNWSDIVNSYRLHKVETLMLNLLVELRLLLLNDMFLGHDALFGQDQTLADACKRFAKALPSLPASDSPEPPAASLTEGVSRSEEEVSKKQTSQTSTQDTAKNHYWKGLLLAVKRGHTDLVQILLEKDGINPDHKDESGRTPL